MPKMPIKAVELQEYLFADAAAGLTRDGISNSDLRWEIRSAFRLQRFAVMNWLLMNGVTIPGDLLSDQAHPPVGRQWPDEKGIGANAAAT
jgi:hypothetical protein